MKKISKNQKALLFLAVALISVLILMNIPENKRQTQTQHFTFIYSAGIDANKLSDLAKAMEDNYSRVSQDLKTVPANNIEVNIYAERWRYIQATHNWTASGSIEGTSKLHFVEQAWGESDNKKVAVHEFTHAVLLKLLIDREPKPLDDKKFIQKFSEMPVWLWEGVSVYEAGQFNDPRTMSFFSNGSYPSLSELNNRSKGGKIYSVGYTIIEYILDKYGQDKLIELIASYGNLSKTLAVTEGEFSKGWYGFIKEKYLK